MVSTDHAEQVPSDEQSEGPTLATTIRVEVLWRRVCATRVDQGTVEDLVSSEDFEAAPHSQIMHIRIPSFPVTQYQSAENTKNEKYPYPTLMKASMTNEEPIDA
jgi:hypothetical protein